MEKENTLQPRTSQPATVEKETTLQFRPVQYTIMEKENSSVYNKSTRYSEERNYILVWTSAVSHNGENLLQFGPVKNTIMEKANALQSAGMGIKNGKVSWKAGAWRTQKAPSGGLGGNAPGGVRGRSPLKHKTAWHLPVLPVSNLV